MTLLRFLGIGSLQCGFLAPCSADFSMGFNRLCGNLNAE